MNISRCSSILAVIICASTGCGSGDVSTTSTNNVSSRISILDGFYVPVSSKGGDDVAITLDRGTLVFELHFVDATGTNFGFGTGQYSAEESESDVAMTLNMWNRERRIARQYSQKGRVSVKSNGQIQFGKNLYRRAHTNDVQSWNAIRHKRATPISVTLPNNDAPSRIALDALLDAMRKSGENIRRIIESA